MKRQLLSDENAINPELKLQENGEPIVRIPLSPKRINQNGQILKVDPRQPMKKRILAYNQMLMKENQEKLASPSNVSLHRPFLPAVDSSPRRKLDVETSPRPVSLSETNSNATSPRKYEFLKELDSSVGQRISSLSKSPRCEKSHRLSPEVRSEFDPSERWNGALALMQLASSPPSRKFSQQS